MKKKPFTTIHNDVLEALFRAPLKARELRLLLFVSRMTHGFNKSRMKMSERKISERTGLNRGSLRRAFQSLTEMKILEIHKPASGKRAAVFGINGEPETWLVDQQGDPLSEPRGSDGDPLKASSGSGGDPLESASGSDGDPLADPLVDQGVIQTGSHGDPRGGSGGDPLAGSHGDPLGDQENEPQTLATPGPERDDSETPKDRSLKENIFKENITKTVPAPPDVLSYSSKGSIPETGPEPDPLETHFEPAENFWDQESFRGARVVAAYRLLYGGKDPGPGDLKFAHVKLTQLKPAVSGPRRLRDLEGALILAAQQLRHDMALGKDVKNPWAYVWTLVPDHLVAAKEFNYRIRHGFLPDEPAAYIWDAENAVLRANKRREQFLRWMDANEARRVS